MAVLSTTSPGQLGKYVIPTVEAINSGRVSTASKTYTLKKGTENDEAVKAFLQLGMGGSSTQQQALDIVLQTFVLGLYTRTEIYLLDKFMVF